MCETDDRNWMNEDCGLGISHAELQALHQAANGGSEVARQALDEVVKEWLANRRKS